MTVYDLQKIATDVHHATAQAALEWADAMIGEQARCIAALRAERDTAKKWARLWKEAARFEWLTSNANQDVWELRRALEAVVYFWGRDPQAFGDDASVTTLAGKFAAIAYRCRAALALRSVGG